MRPYLHTVGIVVRDMPSSLAFYRTLGLDIPAGEDHSTHVEYAGPSGYSIGFVAESLVRETDPRWRDGAGQKLNLQFRFEESGEVDSAHARLIEAGYESYQEPWDAFWGQRFARVLDPDGNVVNLFAPLVLQL